MLAKKTNKASLENKRAANFIIGLMITLSLVLISFEWTRPINIQADLMKSAHMDIDEQIIVLIPRDNLEPEKPELPPIMEVINIVPDEIELEDFSFDVEVGPQTQYDIYIVNNEPEEIIEEDIHYIVKEMPKFNGGNASIEFSRYIVKHLRYPEIAAENGIDGRVIVQFDIDKEGYLVDAVIYRSIDPALDAEALRVVRTSPRWTPGKQGIKNVKVRYVFPIMFVLQ